MQNYYGVRCDPSLPYDVSFAAPDKPPKQPIPVSRPNFIELCNRLTAEDEKAFEGGLFGEIDRMTGVERVRHSY